MIRLTHPSRLLPFSAVTSVLLSVGMASAQDGAMEEPASDETETDFSDMDEGEEPLSEEPATAETTPPPSGSEEAFEASGDRKPDGSTQLLLGVRYRALITPKFLINMFGVDGGRTVLLHGVGPEIGGYFGETNDGFMVLFSPWYVGYGLEETPFKGKNDDDTAWEIIESRMKVWYLSVDAMWDHKLMDGLSVDVGLGAGLGIVTGKLYRNEAFVDNSDPDIDEDKDWPNLSACESEGISENGIGDAVQCPADGSYGAADRWPVYPWLNFQMGLRYQPVDEFVGRLDFGLGSSGFWIGLGADYALFL